MGLPMQGGISIHVNGIPAPQGSKRHIGRGIMVESSKAVKPWRDAVRTETQHRLGDPILDGPVIVAIVFRLPRPKGHTGKRGLLPSAPRVPAVKPDLDKLVRAVLDGITDGGAIRDDAQVAVLAAQKTYADGPNVPGAVITITPMA